jgi:WD repeat-containing protein 59
MPRFLPQGGCWDVADVQWNPHASREEYIVSTSSEKLYVVHGLLLIFLFLFLTLFLPCSLIWNLLLEGKTSIQHILYAHYRAITDINWHTSEPHVVASTGIDAWVWTWDLREARKPVLGVCSVDTSLFPV